MNTKNIPAIISLVAGLISVIITYLKRAELVNILTTLFIVLLSFYVFGCIVKVVIDKYAAEDEIEAEEEEESELENVDTEESEV